MVSYRSDIDGLRAVAVALVVAFHAAPAVVGGGFIGVDVFFVISGYLITQLILSSEFTFAGFYARRVRRILPALVVVLAAVLSTGWWLLLPKTYLSLGLHALAGVLFFPNLLSWHEVGYFDAAAETKPLLHLWSLGVEEQFYLVWPVLLLVLSRRRNLGLLAIVAASFLYSCYATAYQPAAAFYSPLSRLWELGAGGLIASANVRVKNREMASLLGIALIVGSAIMLEKASPFPGMRALIPVIGTVLVIVFGSRLLSHRWFVAVGLISYPLYLWHWPLLSFATIAGVTSLPMRCAIVAASFALATLTTMFVERPIRFGRLRRSGVAATLAAAAIVAASSALVWRSGGLPWRYPEEIRSVLTTGIFWSGKLEKVNRCWLDGAAPFDKYEPQCSVGTTLVWGDSTAAHFAAGLRADGADVAQFTRDSCLPSIGSTDAVCAKSNVAILRRIAEIKPKRVILFASWSSHLDSYQSGLAATLDQLRDIVDDVVVVGPGPIFPQPVPSQVYEYWTANGHLPDRMQPRPENYRKIDDTLAAISNAAHARFISAFDLLCNDSGCLTHTPASASEMLFYDYGHLTLPGARFLAGAMGIH